MSTILQVKAGIPIVLDPGLLARAMKNNLPREEQLRNPLVRAVADLQPDRPWDALLGRKQELQHLYSWITKNVGEHIFDANISQTACTNTRILFYELQVQQVMFCLLTGYMLISLCAQQLPCKTLGTLFCCLYSLQPCSLQMCTDGTCA